MCIYTRQRELTFLGVYAKILIKNLTCFGFHFPLGFSRAYRMLVKLHFRHFPQQSPANNNGAPNGKRKAAQRVAMVNNILPRLFTSPLTLSPFLTAFLALTYFCALFNISYFSMSRAAVAIGTFTWAQPDIFSMLLFLFRFLCFFTFYCLQFFNFPPAPLSSSLTQFELCGLTVLEGQPESSIYICCIYIYSVYIVNFLCSAL